MTKISAKPSDGVVYLCEVCHRPSRPDQPTISYYRVMATERGEWYEMATLLKIDPDIQYIGRFIAIDKISGWPQSAPRVDKR